MSSIYLQERKPCNRLGRIKGYSLVYLEHRFLHAISLDESIMLQVLDETFVTGP